MSNKQNKKRVKRKKLYTVEKIKIKSTGRDIKVLIIRPTLNVKTKEQTPGILWIHGGGFVGGMAEMIYFTRAISLVKKYGAVIITPSYRLSIESPYPAALEDCYSTLKYLKEHAEELGVNSSQIMVGGESAGGGLAACLCMYARDKGEVNIACQMPLYPMLDSKDPNSSKDNHKKIFQRKINHWCWKLYLRKYHDKEVPPYASASRQTDYSNLPPAYTFIGDKEIFHCETLTYIENLKKAGVEAKVDIYKNWYHGYDLVHPHKKIVKEAIRNFEKEYLYATKNYFKEQNK